MANRDSVFIVLVAVMVATKLAFQRQNEEVVTSSDMVNFYVAWREIYR